MSSNNMEVAKILLEDSVAVLVDSQDLKGFKINSDKVVSNNHLETYLKNLRNFSEELLKEVAGELLKPVKREETL